MKEWTPRHAQLVAALLLERTAATGELTVFLSAALVREAKKLWPRFAGLRGWSRTSARRRFMLLTSHHPAQLCWEWSIGVEFFPRFAWRWLVSWYRPNGFLQSAYLQLPGLIRFDLHRQTYGWMLSHNGEQRLRQKVDQHCGSLTRIAA